MTKQFLLVLVLSLFFFACNDEGQKPDYPSIIELIAYDNNSLSKEMLTTFCAENGIDKNAVYNWENHWVLYSQFQELQQISEKLEANFANVTIKTYDQPFYSFDRTRCDDSSIAEEWDNILLTANLVEDTLKQSEYMEYHRTQFEEWPEVAQGFCNASFQQLLVFRTGRQLMLIISIPKGESLDELNPKTTENNLRVDEWNAQMSQYQEGLEEAPEGVVWLFLNPVE
ncbi:L-rhamnose mutarotase [uncultured Sunxiuqinia sp.]|uniref:L-rhamnose mutarotase n=1 Tax=uncultured Sunxiuqinia sp. TaxID=1573825 RepID=UPI002AA6130B|nr:L-rhamnose mutarotase [uncultured Sunxiuqinia sp.]